MGRRRGNSGLEDMDERPGFRSTFDQREWFEDARIAAGAVSLSDWLREMAIEAGKKLLDKPYPRRKVVQEQQAPKRVGSSPKKKDR